MPTKDEMKKFAYSIDSLVANNNCSYIDAIIEYCENTGLELEIAASLINANLKKKIESDAMNRNQLKEKVVKLPL